MIRSGALLARTENARGEYVLPEVRTWLGRRTSTAGDWSPRTLRDAKGSTSISVVLPARNERATVGGIVATIRRELMERVDLVDEIVVIDSRSTDDTAAVARAAGARVAGQDQVLAHLPPLAGKGEALWKSLAATRGDLLVFVDADLRNLTPAFVTGLLGPLLTDGSVGYVKGSYDRSHISAGGTVVDDGGRVTELVARPLLNLHWPRLAGFVQPLAGEYAGRRSVLERVPFVTGYGVELGLLVDLLELLGLDGMAQADLGRREHSHQSTAALGRMSGQVLHTAWSRLEKGGVVSGRPSTRLAQFHRAGAGSGHVPDVHDVRVDERPPMIEVPGYRELPVTRAG